MTSILAVVVVLLAVFLASRLLEQTLGRSPREFQTPAWYVVFFLVFTPAIAATSAWMPFEHPFLFAAYGLCGGMASLVAQALYGQKIQDAR